MHNLIGLCTFLNINITNDAVLKMKFQTDEYSPSILISIDSLPLVIGLDLQATLATSISLIEPSFTAYILLENDI